MEIITEGRNFRLVQEHELTDVMTVLEKYMPEALKVCIRQLAKATAGMIIICSLSLSRPAPSPVSPNHTDVPERSNLEILFLRVEKLARGTRLPALSGLHTERERSMLVLRRRQCRVRALRGRTAATVQEHRLQQLRCVLSERAHCVRRSARHRGRADRLARANVPEFHTHRHHGPAGGVLCAQLRRDGATGR